MAKYGCKCGKTLSNSLCPNDIQLKVFTDKQWEQLYEKSFITGDDFPDPEYDVWRCPDCKRIYVFDGTRLIMQYVLETD
ncbi:MULTISPECIES: hypothetical protein [Brevibacillus]|jgi:hypothetical protein|uniref:Uncharacterized protein n=1 Tax=Brevibacillus parabrevis TaxID=54914 RepID=A0A4Y3PN24_BREPA|nr:MULTISPECIES: hypothetical protein [Brevibacillus]KZE42817.1 hypothetical protein AV540_25440 [Brevibacillus parabrevis]MBU8710893.1 hypothetical protein [Brevibacillus parabrevis]MDH6351741.1 hypothetical protein [Brevibacillus sp. 1238]MDR5002164.1 hypothetical protein [Brevibacillus parabrevis]MED2253562.1 hypothetical protein [Brevibacillus parabrevis]